MDTVKVIELTVESAKQLIEVVGADLKSISASGQAIANDTQAVVADIRKGQGTFGKLVTDDELYRRANAIAQQAELTVTNIREASQQAKQAIAGLQSMEGPAQGLTTEFRQTLASAREVMTDLAENAEALKRNWFFRGFFRERGYFDLDMISPAEYRAGALEQDGRRRLAIWLRADVLFVRDPQGIEVLSPSGKVRVESAMAEFLKYPTTTAIVVEGYAANVSRDQAHLVSRDRARRVRDYLVVRFELEPARVGIMPLGAEADGSPAGKTWEGVAIAAFAAREAPSRTRAGGS